MSINVMLGLILSMVIGTSASYLAIQGVGFLIRYIYNQINDKEFTDEEVIFDARKWCNEDDRIVFVMVKTDDKVNLVTKNGARDATDIYNKFHKEENNEPEDEDTDRTDDRDDNDSSDEDRQ